MGLYIFLQLFGMACKLPVAPNTAMRSAYSERNKPFFPTPKFRQQLDSKGKARIFFPARPKGRTPCPG